MTERMHGFPILPDLIQGLLWRVTSHIQAPNLIGLLGVLPLVGIIKRLFGVPLTYSLIALWSIPVVLIQSSSSYIDLFSNAWFAAMLMLIWSAVVQPAAFSIARLLCLFTCFAIVLNSKMQLAALALAALGISLLLLWIGNQRYARLRSFVKHAESWRKLGVLGALVTLVALGLENPVKNLIRFHNPVYPSAIVGGKVDPPAEWLGKPDYLAHSSQPFRWLLSVVEYKSFEGRRPLWTNGQGDVAMDSPALFMGGFFGALVLFNVLWFAFLQSKVKERLGWAPLWFMGAITLITAFLPGSTVSRFYIYWIVCLVLINLVMIMNDVSDEFAKDAKILYVGGMASFLVFVLCANGLVYIHQTGMTTERIARDARTRLIAAHLREGEVICMVNTNPWTLFFSPMFQPELRAKLHYKVQEVYEPSDCQGLRPLP
jgi:hypothetical protein